MAYVQYSEQAILNSMFGNLLGCVHTAISAGATAQTSIAGGTYASAGTVANWDVTPASTAQIWVGTPGSGATKNQYTAPHAFNCTASSSSTVTIPSQSIGLAISVGDMVFQMGTTAAPLGGWTLNTIYVGLSTATYSSTQAAILAAEPTSTGSYARIVLANSTLATWTAATAASPSVMYNGATAWSFAASTAAWSTGATNLVTAFIADASTLAGGNILVAGALGTGQAVNGAA